MASWPNRPVSRLAATATDSLVLSDLLPLLCTGICDVYFFQRKIKTEENKEKKEKTLRKKINNNKNVNPKRIGREWQKPREGARARQLRRENSFKSETEH